MSQENQKKTKSDAELALKVFAEHLLQSFYREEEFAQEKLDELRAQTKYGDAVELPNTDYETYRFWEGQKSAYEEVGYEIHSFMRRLGYEEY